MRRLSIIASLALLESACNGGGDSMADAAPAGSDGFQPARVGYVSIVEGGAGESLFAQLRDRPDVPAPELIASDGDCAVYARPQPAFCDPPCAAGFCAAPDTCEPWPEFASAGVITVTGLKEPLGFVPNTFWYNVDPVPTGADLFDDGDAITASAPGDVTGAFELTATGVATLEADLPTTLVIEDGVDEVITWTPASSGRVQLALQVGWHGAPYEALLLCETEDDGSLTVPGPLIAQFPRASSQLEQHASWLTRFTRAVMLAPAGPIELFVGSRLAIAQIEH